MSIKIKTTEAAAGTSSGTGSDSTLSVNILAETSCFLVARESTTLFEIRCPKASFIFNGFPCIA